jgi:hypothetical protein
VTPPFQSLLETPLDMACSLSRRIAIEKRSQQGFTQPASEFRRDKENVFVTRLHEKSASRFNILKFCPDLRKSKEEARKTEEKKRINSALRNQHLEIILRR